MRNLGYIVKYKDKSIPTQCVLFTTLNKIDKKKILPSIQQTYDWNEIEEVVEKCNYSILFSDFMGIKDDNLTRISIFNNALKSIVKNTNCKGLHFINNQKIVEPKSFVKRIDDMELSSEAFNVRFFNIEGTNDMVMDTLGLFAFGLPDLQCHFKDLDPNEIARILFNTGYYIFEKGDVIEDGHTVQGINQEDKWECRHEESLVEPKRIVLDLNPGAPYAAGNR